jgi:hypothetical protein
MKDAASIEQKYRELQAQYDRLLEHNALEQSRFQSEVRQFQSEAKQYQAQA